MSHLKLYLIRHAEVEARYHRVFGGRIDMDLSPAGHEQAQQLARFLHSHTIDALYASPMKRARQTLSPLQQLSGHTPLFLDDLREVDFGDWTGLGWQDVERRFAVSAFDWLEKLDGKAIPNAECPQAWRQRVQACLKTILSHPPSQTVAVVCHGGVIRMLLSILLDLPLARTAQFEVEYASITCLDHAPRGTRIRYLNLTPWRDLP